MNRFDKEAERIERDLMSGIISNAEYREQMRDLREEEISYADEMADQTRRDILGEW